MVSKKDRRNSGYVTPNLTVSKRDLIRYDLFVNPFYDNWSDWRDGMRNGYDDFKLIKRIPWKTPGHWPLKMWEKRIQMNQKQKRLLRRRRERRKKRNFLE